MRDANARGDYTAAEFDFDTFEVCRETEINIVGAPLDVSNRIYLALVEAWLDALELIKARHAGTTVKTPERPEFTPPSSASGKEVTLDTLLKGWQIEKRPGDKTFYTFERQLKRYETFLKGRSRTIASARADDAADWKAELLKEGKSLKTVANILAAGKALMG